MGLRCLGQVGVCKTLSLVGKVLFDLAAYEIRVASACFAFNSEFGKGLDIWLE